MIKFIKKYLKSADIIINLYHKYTRNIGNFLKNIDINKNFYNVKYHYYTIKDFVFFKRNFYKISNFIFFDVSKYIEDEKYTEFNFRIINK